jgi:hypothetical protein
MISVSSVLFIFTLLIAQVFATNPTAADIAIASPGQLAAHDVFPYGTTPYGNYDFPGEPGTTGQTIYTASTFQTTIVQSALGQVTGVTNLPPTLGGIIDPARMHFDILVISQDLCFTDFGIFISSISATPTFINGRFGIYQGDNTKPNYGQLLGQSINQQYATDLQSVYVHTPIDNTFAGATLTLRQLLNVPGTVYSYELPAGVYYIGFQIDSGAITTYHATEQLLMLQVGGNQYLPAPLADIIGQTQPEFFVMVATLTSTPGLNIPLQYTATTPSVTVPAWTPVQAYPVPANAPLLVTGDYDATNLYILAKPLGSCRGDPQFTGFRQQKYQVHGMSDLVYNIISTEDLQVNSLFVYRNSGQCRQGTACYSHPGNYFGELGMLIKDEFTNQITNIQVVSGPVEQGLKVLVNNQLFNMIDQTFKFANTSVKLLNNFELQVESNLFNVVVQNSDMFVNLDVSLLKNFNSNSNSVDDPMMPHGLLGQTWATKQYNNKWKFIQGDLMQYVVQDGLFGIDFAYNRFD